MKEDKKSESIVVKPREPFSDAILSQNADALAKFMDEPVSAVAEAMTGWLAAGPKAWMVMTGHIVQATLKGKLFQQVSREIKELRDKGKILDDFAEKKYGFQSWVELLKAIDDEAPDEDKLNALKAMFYAVNKIGAEDSERILNYQLFQIAKRLSSGQLLLLKVVFEAYQSGSYATGGNTPITQWAEQMAHRLGHHVSALVIKEQETLVDQGLLSGRVDIIAGPHQVNSHIVSNQNARLTDLGIRFCDNIESYRIVKAEIEQD